MIMLLSWFVSVLSELVRLFVSIALFLLRPFLSSKSSSSSSSSLCYDENGNLVSPPPLVVEPGRGYQMMVFARNFLKNPKQVASIIPSSKSLIQKLLAPIDWEKARVIVEYGPGIGNISHEVLQRMRPDAKLILIELNPDLANYIQRSFKDERVISLNRSAEDTVEVLRELGIEKADYVISGIPFSMLPSGVGDRVVKATWDALRPGGIFLIYQYRKTVREALSRVFSNVEIHFAPINIPPAHVYYAHRT